MKACAILHLGPEAVGWREVEIARPGVGELLVQAEFSAISAGTESLVFRSEISRDLEVDTTIPQLQGRFAYPFSYGYALVGRVVQVGANGDRAWLGRRVMVFHPHQDWACVRAADCWPVPDEVSSQAACFLPNTESAVSLVMDARPGLGERFLVLGQGILGLLTTAILNHFPLSELVASDPVAVRRQWAARFGATVPDSLADYIADGHPAGAGFDGVIELSGNMKALDEAIAVAGYGARIVIGSWYGLRSAAIDLGGAFHRRRLRLESSQVSSLAAELTDRWNKRRRLALAWDWVRRIQPDCLITHTFAPMRCQEAFELAADADSGALQVMFRY